MSTQVTINDVLPKTQIVATSGQTVFSTNWTANAASDIQVFKRASGVNANDLTQALLPNQYTVNFVGSEQDVEVTLLSGATTGDIVTIIRDTPADRLNLYNNTNFTASMLNQDVGILTLVDQQAQLYNEELTPRFNKSCTLTDANIPSIDTVLPVLGANQLWIKNSSNTGMTVLTLTGEPAPDSAAYWVSAGNTGLTNEVNVGALSTGLLKITVSSAVATPTPAVLGSDYYGPGQGSPIPVEFGGTEVTAFTPNAVVCGGTNSTAPLQTVAVGTAGQILTSNGASAPPSFQNFAFVGIPIGGGLTHYGTTPPSGFYVCDGSAKNRITDAALFAEIGTTYGAGDGSTTFNLPNRSRRVSIGSGGSATGVIGNAVGDVGGTETITLIGANLPVGTPINSGGTSGNSLASTASGTANVPSNNTANYLQGSGAAVNIMQPALVVLECIRYQ